MPQTTVLTKSRYRKLVDDLKQIIHEGRERAKSAVNQELIQTYWDLGKRIIKEDLSENANYAALILEDVAEELAMDPSTLKRSVYFFQTYQVRAPRRTNITWSHYQELIAVRPDVARKFYEDLTTRENWTRDDLRNAIKNKMWLENQGLKKKRGNQLKRPDKALYVYKAIVERVIDGDTLLIRLDLGFQVCKVQRIRLAQVDTPEKDTKAGRKAFEYVRDTLAQADFVVVQTNKIDIYGRYIGDVFYAFGQKKKEKIFTDGRYLNQELLDRGLAKRV